MKSRQCSLKPCLRCLTLVGCLCVFVISVSGCTPLRKKFTRKKKQEKELKFIPVLEPVDYPPKTYSSEERYKQHYSLWKVWNNDLLQTIERKGSDKNQKYLLEQMILQLDGMKKWITEEKQHELSELLDDLYAIRKALSAPAPMRNMISIKKKLELNAKKIRNGFTPKVIQSYFIN